jgi:hypothetical protein
MYMSKMGLHDPFGHLKRKLWPKEAVENQIANLTRDLLERTWKQARNETLKVHEMERLY